MTFGHKMQKWPKVAGTFGQKRSLKMMGDRIKNARDAMGLDQNQFAEAIGVATRSTISRWERGLNYPPADILALIHNKFEIDLNWLITGEGSMHCARGAEICPDNAPRDNESEPKGDCNIELLETIIREVKLWIRKERLSLDPAKEAKIIVLLYDHFINEGVVKQSIFKRFMSLFL